MSGPNLRWFERPGDSELPFTRSGTLGHLLRVGVPATAVIKSLDNGCVESQMVSGIAVAEDRQPNPTQPNPNPRPQAGVPLTIEKVSAMEIAIAIDDPAEASMTPSKRVTIDPIKRHTAGFPKDHARRLRRRCIQTEPQRLVGRGSKLPRWLSG